MVSHKSFIEVFNLSLTFTRFTGFSPLRKKTGSEVGRYGAPQSYAGVTNRKRDVGFLLVFHGRFSSISYRSWDFLDFRHSVNERKQCFSDNENDTW
jgi:hypothetical protein